MLGQSRAVGLVQATSLLIVCAAPVPRAVDQLLDHPRQHAGPIVRLLVPGQEVEIAEWRGSTADVVLRSRLVGEDHQEPQLGRLRSLRRQRPRSVVRPAHKYPLLTVVDRP